MPPLSTKLSSVIASASGVLIVEPTPISSRFALTLSEPKRTRYTVAVAFAAHAPSVNVAVIVARVHALRRKRVSAPRRPEVQLLGGGDRRVLQAPPDVDGHRDRLAGLQVPSMARQRE